MTDVNKKKRGREGKSTRPRFPSSGGNHFTRRLRLRAPKPVEVAELIDRHRGALRHVEDGLRCHAGLQVRNLQALLARDGYELDVVLRQHRVLDRAHAHAQLVALALDRGHVLLVRPVGRAGLQKPHGLPAADGRHSPVDQDSHDVPAMRALV